MHGSFATAVVCSLQLWCCRAIMMADRCLLFDPDTVSSRKFLEAVEPRLQASMGSRAQKARHKDVDADSSSSYSEDDNRPPFELECLEAAFLVAIGTCHLHPPQ